MSLPFNDAVYRGRSRAIKISPCGPPVVGEPTPPITDGPAYYGKSRAIKAGYDHGGTGPRVSLVGADPVYYGVSRALKVRSCPIYVGGAAYGPDFDGNPVTTSSGDSGWVTSFQGEDRISWLTEAEQLTPPADPFSYSEVERMAADGTGVFVQFIEGNGIDFDNNWALAKYSPEGVLLWGPIRRPGQDSYDIKCVDGRVFTSFGGPLNPIMIDPDDGSIIFEYGGGDPYDGFQSGAAKGPGDTLYVTQRVAFPSDGRVHRVGAGGIEASSGPISDLGSVDYYGGSHPDPNRFYMWYSIFPGTATFDEWQGYPTVERIRTVFSWTSGFIPTPPFTSGIRQPDAIAVDQETGNIFMHGLGPVPYNRVNGYDADGVPLWEVDDQGIFDDSTQMCAKNGLAYVAGFVEVPPEEAPGGMLPALLVLDGETGAVVEPLRKWAADSTETMDVYGLAVA